MAFARDPIRFSGVLLGNGSQANCTISAVRVFLIGSGLFKDCQYAIEWVSKSLPQGLYKLALEGKIVDVLHSKDGWRVDTATTPAVQDTRKVKPSRT